MYNKTGLINKEHFSILHDLHKTASESVVLQIFLTLW